LISAGRGAVIDNSALITRLSQNKDILVALDVWENEPDISAELLSLVDIATPHIAGHSVEGKEQGTVMVFQQLCKHLGITAPVDITDIVNTDTSALPSLPNAHTLNTHALNPSDSVPELILNQVLLAAYPIMVDEGRLRAWDPSGQTMAKYFDCMRKNYPIRREYSHFIFPAVAQRPPVSDWLDLLR
jgi:erythronate-4-phosphate dehydrogenase